MLEAAHFHSRFQKRQEGRGGDLGGQELEASKKGGEAKVGRRGKDGEEIRGEERQGRGGD